MEPVTVWRVQLRRGDVGDREGTLRLEDDALVFEDLVSASEITLPLADIRSARRVKGSPILIVAYDDASRTSRDRLLLLAAPAARGAAARQRGHVVRPGGRSGRSLRCDDRRSVVTSGRT